MNNKLEKNKMMKMRLILTICVMLLIALGVDAQKKKKKPSLSKAKIHWERQELVEAKNIIDEAIVFEKTMNNGKTWYYRGLIYASIDTTTNENFKTLSNNALETAVASFAKAESIDPEGGYFIIDSNSGLPVLLDQQISTWYGFYFQKAIDAYETNEYSKSVDAFVRASMIIPEDTGSVSNAAYASVNMDDKEGAIKFFTKAIDRGAVGKSNFTNLISLYSQQESYDSALEFLDRAMEVYPTDNDLNRTKVDILKKAGKLEQAREELKRAIDKEPNDPLLPFYLGILFEETGETEEAMKWYVKATEVDSSYYDAYFNIAVLKYNTARDLIEEKNLLNPYSKKDQIRDKQLNLLINKALKEAIPDWEKLYEFKKDNRTILETLIFIYDRTGQTSKADQVEKDLEKLPKE